MGFNNSFHIIHFIDCYFSEGFIIRFIVNIIVLIRNYFSIVKNTARIIVLTYSFIIYSIYFNCKKVDIIRSIDKMGIININFIIENIVAADIIIATNVIDIIDITRIIKITIVVTVFNIIMYIIAANVIMLHYLFNFDFIVVHYNHYFIAFF